MAIAYAVFSIIFPEPTCGNEDTRPVVLQKVHAFYITLIIFIATVIVDVIISLCTAEPNDSLLVRTTFWRRHSSASSKRRSDMEKIPQTDPFRFLIDEDAYEEEVRHWRHKSNVRLCYEWFCGYASYDVTPKRIRTRDTLTNTKFEAVDISQRPRPWFS